MLAIRAGLSLYKSDLSYPGWVLLFYQSDLPGSQPAFQLLFGCDCVVYILESFEPDEAIAIVAYREAGIDLAFMLEDSSLEVASHADIQVTAAAGHYVRGVGMLVLHNGQVDSCLDLLYGRMPALVLIC